MDSAQQGLKVNGLGDHQIHSRSQTLVVLGLGCVSRQRNDRYCGHFIQALRNPNLARRHVPIHFWHIEVHEDQII